MTSDPKDLLSRALAELKEFLGPDECDHSVGVCYCSVYMLMEEIEEYLRRQQENPIDEL